MEALGDSKAEELLDFPDCNPPTDPEAWDYGLWSADSCARDVCSQLTVWAYHLPRVGVSQTFLELFNINLVRLVLMIILSSPLFWISRIY
jgi:hypothetical protein